MIVECCGICVKKHEGSSHGLGAGSFHAHQLVERPVCILVVSGLSHGGTHIMWTMGRR